MKWTARKLGDVVTLQRGHDLPEAQRRDGTIPIISSSGHTGMHDTAKAKGPGVVTGRYGTLGEVYYVEEDYWPLNTALYVVDFKGNDPRFISYFLKQALTNLQSDKAAVPGVNRNVVHALDVRAPDYRTQRRIAAILSAYDDLIENNRRRIELLEDAARQLYQEWFVRLRFPGHEHTRLEGGVPDGWRRTTIAEFVGAGGIDLQTGPFGTQLKASDYVDEGTPVINVRNIGYGSLRSDKLELVGEATAERLGVHILRLGDIVFGRKGAVDRHVLVDVQQVGWMQGSDCIRLRTLTPNVPPTLLSCALREKCHQDWILAQCSNKATMPSLNQEVIGRIPIIVPPRTLADEFHRVASGFFTQVGRLGHLSDQAAKTRDLLLPRLMSGEVPA